VQRRLLIGAGAFGVSAVTAYSDDLTDLQFDAASAAGHLLKLADAESAHSWGIWAAKHGLVPRERRPDPLSLRTAVWGREFRNPIGAVTRLCRGGAQPILRPWPSSTGATSWLRVLSRQPREPPVPVRTLGTCLTACPGVRTPDNWKYASCCLL